MIKLAEVHLLRLQAFLLEVAGVLVNLRKGGLLKLAILLDISACDVALPAIQKAPRARLSIPDSASRKYAPRERKGGGIKFKEREICEFVAFGVKKLVVEDAVGLSRMRLAEYPVLFGAQDGLRRFALDDVAQSLLPAVGLGQIVLIEKEEADRQNGGDGDDGNHQPVKADTAGLHGNDLGVAVEYAECDQHGDQHGQRGDLVKHAGGEVDQIFADSIPADVVAENVL